MSMSAGAVAGGGIGLAACPSGGQPTAGQTPAPASSTAQAHSAKASPSPSVSASASASVTIAAVGDTMLGTSPDLPPDPATYLDAVKPELDAGAQIVFG